MHHVTYQDAIQACHNLSPGKLSQHVDPQASGALIVGVSDRWADHQDRSLSMPVQTGPPPANTSALPWKTWHPRQTGERRARQLRILTVLGVRRHIGPSAACCKVMLIPQHSAWQDVFDAGSPLSA